MAPGTGPGVLDRLIDGLDYPMFVVTTAAGGERSGCLIGFATQTSIHPARLLVCLSVQNHTYRVAREASALGVHVLGSDQLDLAAVFGTETGDEVDKFAQCRWREGPEGVPVLDDCSAWMVGGILDRVAFGDHVGFVLEPAASGRNDHRQPLRFHQVDALPPGHPA